MMTRSRLVTFFIGSVLLAVGLASPVVAGARQPVPHGGGGGGGSRSAVPSHGHVSAGGTAAARGHVPAHGTATGIARYGYGYGYPYHGGSYWYGYPYWGWGWYGAWWWGWPYGYGYGYAPYAYYGSAPYDGGDDDYEYAPAPHGPATVETAISPSKAEVVLDGDSVGYASDYNGRWDSLRVKPGAHTIAFREKGYRTLVIEFTARPGATYKLTDKLAQGDGEERRSLPVATATATPPAPREEPPNSPSAPTATGRLRVQAMPPDAAVYLDGEYLGLGVELGRIHGALAVATGSHRLDVVRPGYVSAVRKIEVGEADVTAVELTLEREH